MAYYLTNDNYNTIATRQGIKLISDYLLSNKEEVHIELRHVGTNDEVILIQTVVGSGSLPQHYSNTVSFHTQVGQIMINPVFFNGENATDKLIDFIVSIPQLIRDQKLDSIL